MLYIRVLRTGNSQRSDLRAHRPYPSSYSLFLTMHLDHKSVRLIAMCKCTHTLWLDHAYATD